MWSGLCRSGFIEGFFLVSNKQTEVSRRPASELRVEASVCVTEYFRKLFNNVASAREKWLQEGSRPERLQAA